MEAWDSAIELHPQVAPRYWPRLTSSALELLPCVGMAAPTTTAPANDVDQPSVHDPALALCSDAAVADAVASVVSQPKAGSTNSFTLHAPLEVAARAALLPHVLPEHRAAARSQLASIGPRYRDDGEGAAEAAPAAFESAVAACTAFGSAVAAGDVEGADSIASWLADHVGGAELVPLLAPTILPSLAAAAHGSIWLDQVRRGRSAAPSGRRALRGIARGVAQFPDWKLTWHEHEVGSAAADLSPHGPSSSDGTELATALVAPPSPGSPGSDFIFPIMSLTESSGLAATMLAGAIQGVRYATAERVLLRTAAASMLQDDQAQAPYGWSHCMTLPQAALGIGRSLGRRSDAVAVAATFVLGFRGVHGRVALAPGWEPELVGDPLAALEGPATEAAGAAWHAPAEQVPQIWAILVSKAACHPDAHLAKYTLACLDAERDDPDAGRLYLAAAAHLNGWWNGVDASTYT
jgi:hypothetical protein